MKVRDGGCFGVFLEAVERQNKLSLLSNGPAIFMLFDI